MDMEQKLLKYNGYVEFEIEDNRFICDVLLYMNLKG